MTQIETSLTTFPDTTIGDMIEADLRGTDLSGASHDESTRWDGAVISLRTALPDDLDLAGSAGGLVIDPAG